MIAPGTFGLMASLGLEGVVSVGLGAAPSMLVVEGGWVDRGEGRWSLSDICWRDGMRVIRWLLISAASMLAKERVDTHLGDDGTDGGAMLPFLGASFTGPSSLFTSSTFAATTALPLAEFSDMMRCSHFD